MRLLDKLERHFGFIAIPNLIVAVILGQALATVVALKEPTLPLLLMLDPVAVAGGQWWRLFTWVIVPSMRPLDILLAVFWFQFLFIMGQALEAEWGAFRSTLYLLLGVALPSLGSMLLWQLFGAQILLTGWYFSLTLQLAFAALAPEMTILLMFILPVKMKWLAWAAGAFLLWHAFSGGWLGFMEVLFGTGNYLLFFLPSGIRAWRQQRLAQSGRKVFKEAQRVVEKVQQRACIECGRGPEANLRLCTCERCGEEGRTFCEEHLKGHLLPLAAPAKPAAPKKKRKS